MADLTFSLGTDAQGHHVTADLARLPHLLIGGVAGSGKTYCIDHICAQLKGKAEIRRPDAHDARAALNSLHAAEAEMNMRLAAFKAAGVRQLSEYDLPLLPTVIVLDPYDPLFIPFQEEAEAILCRIAGMGRIAGFHLILSTLKLYPEVLTGMLRANIPSRIAFRTATAEHSRLLLDHPGAEQLARPGDMLFYPTGAQDPIFLHCN